MNDDKIHSPTWRKPAGVLFIVLLISLWGFAIASQWEYIGNWPIWGQTIFYLIAGIVWLAPLRPLLIWMETGKFNTPKN